MHPHEHISEHFTQVMCKCYAKITVNLHMQSASTRTHDCM